MAIGLAQEQFILFHQQQLALALPLMHVQEVLNPQACMMTPVPNTYSCVWGLTQLRGQVLLVIDFGRLVHSSHNSGLSPNRIIVVESVVDSSKKGANSQRMGLLVERIQGVASFDEELPTPAPIAGSPLSPWLLGLYQYQQQPWLGLDTQALMATEKWF